MGKNNPSRYTGEGANAFEDGMEILDCPYGRLSSHREDWLDGFEEARLAYMVKSSYTETGEEEDSPEALINDIYALSIDPELLNVLERIVELIKKKLKKVK